MNKLGFNSNSTHIHPSFEEDLTSFALPKVDFVLINVHEINLLIE
jgi:hypothetical protein